MPKSNKRNGNQDRVITAITDLIATGQLRPGQRLPTVRDIANRLTLDLGTVIRAYRRLVTMGVVHLEGDGVRPRAVVSDPGHNLVRNGEIVVVANSGVLEHIDNWRRVAILAGLLEALHAEGRPLTTIPASWVNPHCRQPAILIILEALTLDQIQLVKKWQSDGTMIISGDELPELPGADLVMHDHAAGGAALVQALFHAGKRILLPIWGLGEHEPHWLLARRHGIENAARERGMRLLPSISYPHSSDQSRSGFEREVLVMAGLTIAPLAGTERVDGVLAVTDGLVPVIAAVCDRIGRHVHDDLAITGYDGYWRTDVYQQFRSAVPLATVDKNNRRLGAEMARLAILRLEKDHRPAQRIILPPIVIHSS